jgi:Stage II sporulation protein E (SpoIIE)
VKVPDPTEGYGLNFLPANRIARVLAMNAGTGESTRLGELSPTQVAFMLEELKDLSRLNAAMFRWVFSERPVDKGFFAALFDKTDPDKDGSLSARSSHIGIQGDFYLLRRLGRYIYVVVGDAAGHHAYAGGLIVFVLAALQQVFGEAGWWRSLTALDVLAELRNRFFDVGRAALHEDGGQALRGGANVAVVRIDTRGGPATYASAGLPVFAFGSAAALRMFGDYQDSKGIGFPQDLQPPLKFQPESGRLPTKGADFLAFVTDGFRGLRRAPAATGDAAVEGSEAIFGDDRVKAALLSMTPEVVDPQTRPSAHQVAEKLVGDARQFRKGHAIPEPPDDDRLVVIVDLLEAQRPPEKLPGARWRWIARFLAGILRGPHT